MDLCVIPGIACVAEQSTVRALVKTKAARDSGLGVKWTIRAAPILAAATLVNDIAAANDDVASMIRPALHGRLKGAKARARLAGFGRFTM